jgi:hypothetical protein
MDEQSTTGGNQQTGTVEVVGIECNKENRNKSEEKPIRDERGLFLPGNPGSPGRPKGKSLKEWAREQLERMSEEERIKFLSTMPRDIIWKMAEGMPPQDLRHELLGNISIEISETVAKKKKLYDTDKIPK